MPSKKDQESQLNSSDDEDYDDKQEKRQRADSDEDATEPAPKRVTRSVAKKQKVELVELAAEDANKEEPETKSEIDEDDAPTQVIEEEPTKSEQNANSPDQNAEPIPDPSEQSTTEPTTLEPSNVPTPVPVVEQSA